MLDDFLLGMLRETVALSDLVALLLALPVLPLAP
jgi:hypothetical protein